jgi:hypothetical protein
MQPKKRARARGWLALCGIGPVQSVLLEMTPWAILEPKGRSHEGKGDRPNDHGASCAQRENGTLCRRAGPPILTYPMRPRRPANTRDGEDRFEMRERRGQRVKAGDARKEKLQEYLATDAWNGPLQRTRPTGDRNDATTGGLSPLISIRISLGMPGHPEGCPGPLGSRSGCR